MSLVDADNFTVGGNEAIVVVEPSRLESQEYDGRETIHRSGAEKGAGALHQEAIKVVVRIRPLMNASEGRSLIEVQNSDTVVVRGEGPLRQVQCQYDVVLGPRSSQADLYSHVSECAAAVLEGCNSTIFAYGQTGSGKTHSMYGPPQADHQFKGYGTEAGVIPRAVAHLFKGVASLDLTETGSTPGGSTASVNMWCSLVQIYNEQVFDMLRDPARSNPLAIHEDPDGGTYCQGLSEYAVHTAQECLQLLRLGEDHRAVRETHMNQASSRSHSIFQIAVEQRKQGGEAEGDRILRSKFNLVDLAGSEKWDMRQEMADERVSEMTNINVSLYALGRVIASLSTRGAGAGGHVPYRDSKLTRLLRDSLGGNTRTRIIATLSPGTACVEESISTLRFADRAKQVMAFVKINEHCPIDRAAVDRLQAEVIYLRGLVKELGQKLENTGRPEGGGTSAREAVLQAQLVTERAEKEKLRRDVEGLKRHMTSGVVTSPLGPADHFSGEGSARGESNSDYAALRVAAQVATTASQNIAVAVSELSAKLNSFFSFEIEEDELRSHVESCMVRIRKAASGTRNMSFSGGDPLPPAYIEPPLEDKIVEPTTSRRTKADKDKEKSKADDAPTLQLPAVPGASSRREKPPPITSPLPEPLVPEGGGAPPLPIAYRVRGKRADDTHLITSHMSTSTEELEEERLKRELKAAKKRMKKTLQLQAWLRQKEAKEMEELRAEVAARTALEDAKRAEAAAFKKRAERQKMKLRAYYDVALNREEGACKGESETGTNSCYDDHDPTAHAENDMNNVSDPHSDEQNGPMSSFAVDGIGDNFSDVPQSFDR